MWTVEVYDQEEQCTEQANVYQGSSRGASHLEAAISSSCGWMGWEKKDEYLRCCIKLLKLVSADPAPATAGISHDLNKEERFNISKMDAQTLKCLAI